MTAPRTCRRHRVSCALNHSGLKLATELLRGFHSVAGSNPQRIDNSLSGHSSLPGLTDIAHPGVFKHIPCRSLEPLGIPSQTMCLFVE